MIFSKRLKFEEAFELWLLTFNGKNSAQNAVGFLETHPEWLEELAIVKELRYEKELLIEIAAEYEASSIGFHNLEDEDDRKTIRDELEVRKKREEKIFF